MEQWVKDAVKLAKYQAESFVDDMREMASENDLDADWFIEEVVKHIRRKDGGGE